MAVADRASTMTPRRVLLAIAVSLLLMTVVLRVQGRLWWCACGSPNPLAWDVRSSHNSQHLIDGYTPSHVIHGVLLFGVFWLARRSLTLPWRLLIVTLMEIGWELLENSRFVIERYRRETIATGYEGDAIINSLADVMSCVAGFYLAKKLGLWGSIAFCVGAELLTLILFRDNLTLNVLMLITPIESIKRWQAAG